MPTLVLRNVPDDLSGRLKQAATDHRRSMAQEAIVALQSGLAEPLEVPRRPTVEESLDWLKAEVLTLPVLDRRRDDEILGWAARARMASGGRTRACPPASRYH